MLISKSEPNLFCVCVNQHEKGDIKGEYYHRYIENSEPFENSVSLFAAMEALFDQINYPQATVRPRNFIDTVAKKEDKNKNKQIYHENEELAEFRGAQATFLINVRTRANASWQGEIIWMEEKIKKEFRSMMELMILMDNAVK